MAYHTLTLTAAVAAQIERGASDLPQEDLPGAERCEPGQPLRLVSPAGSLLSLAVAEVYVAIPVGLYTVCLGGSYLIWLLIRETRRYYGDLR